MEKMEFKHIFLTFSVTSFLDLFSTFLLLNFFIGFTERNPIASFFFNFGIGGWITWILISYSLIFLISLFIFHLPSISRKLFDTLKKAERRIFGKESFPFKKRTEDRICISVGYLSFILLLFGDFLVLSNNFFLLFKEIMNVSLSLI